MKPANMKTTSTHSNAPEFHTIDNLTRYVEVGLSPPQAVKSTLVCMAKRVRAKTTPAVIPTAISTSVTSYVEQMAPVVPESYLEQTLHILTLPISQPSHRVKSPRKMRL